MATSFSLSTKGMVHSAHTTVCSLSVLVSILYISSHALALPQCDFPAIFNFGDSNSDTGAWSATFGQAGPPAGETYFHTPSGRYSDGRLLIDFIVESLGLPNLSAYLDALGSNFTHGANFAAAASTIRPGFSPIPYNVQFYQFAEFQTRSQTIREQGSHGVFVIGGVFSKLMPKDDYFLRALYTFDIGQNDLTYGYGANMSTDEVKAYVPDVLDQFGTIIKKIYHQGGRSFWIHNTGPVGCLPYILDRLLITAAQIDRVGCATPFNEVAQYFNQRLKKAVAQLRIDLPLAAITYVDVYSLRYSLFSHAKKHGFKNPLRACCGHGGKYNFNAKVGCGGKITVNGAQILIGKSCKDPSVRVNWDGVHYTEAANKFVFDRIADGSHSDPPIPLKMACHRVHH
ncbi:GDSL esterase/lipase [Thalictrum thalictroides]|uniref:GDSL esterase/lipase n=1 Tax=Thalictrum thalictroides TaxID=46969 RepID=A0A7J6WAP3_THATH|nr:GDSL esterase/lipase [Thalictrum thalictroides]